MSLFCVYLEFHWGDITEKSCQKRGFQKKDEKWDGHIKRVVYGRMVIQTRTLCWKYLICFLF